jgi:hypothetical protein
MPLRYFKRASVSVCRRERERERKEWMEIERARERVVLLNRASHLAQSVHACYNVTSSRRSSPHWYLQSLLLPNPLLKKKMWHLWQCGSDHAISAIQIYSGTFLRRYSGSVKALLRRD